MLNEKVRSSREIAHILREYPGNFETALQICRTRPYLIPHYSSLEDAVNRVFHLMDTVTLDAAGVAQVSKLAQFLGRLRSIDQTAYFFTLNQDLFFERHLHGPLSGINVLYPGVPKAKCEISLGFPNKELDEDFMVEIPENPAALGVDLAGHFNYIKLHGSSNWRRQDGTNMLVIGGAKEEQISSANLLKWYRDIFERVLQKRGLRILIVGYGFGDDHINRVLFDSAVNKSGELFVISPQDAGTLKTVVDEKRKFRDMWGRVVPYQASLQYLLSDSGSGSWERIQAAFLS